ncbi:unnamed protein product [Hymenolepis diminuta]|uniref:DDE Tnp4 domain-containing protein n=1 Tax=Hymenolepis diminuta TaxID=6216 RepID=A0A0R3SPF2_HYMDI|nr:unnamed protein product [Hymenolepis diminuta]
MTLFENAGPYCNNVEVYWGHIDRIDGIGQATHVVRSTSAVSRRRSLCVMIGACLDIYVQIDKQTAGPPVDTVVETLSSVNHFHSPGVDCLADATPISLFATPK